MFRFLSCAVRLVLLWRPFSTGSGFVRGCGIFATLVFVGVLLCPSLPAQTPSLVITHVTVIETRGGTPQPDMTVSINGDRIVAITRSTPDDGKGVQTLDGRGKYLIPGLWDMEVHLSWTTASALPLLVAEGVTGVRDMGGDLGQIDGWRAQIAEGSLVGPSILRTGPMLNGKSFNQYQMVVGTPDEARGVVRTLKFLGVDGLSLERRVPRDTYFALLDEAKKEGIPVGGHVPLDVTPMEVSEAGQSTIENAETILTGVLSPLTPKDKLATAADEFISSDAAQKLFARFFANHTACTPVLFSFQWSLRAAEPAVPEDPRMRYVAKSLRGFAGEHTVPAAELKLMSEMFPEMMRLVSKMHQAGVTLLAGTDIAGPRIPGFSLHDELSMLVGAGLTPIEALRTATLNPATVLDRTDDFGSVDVGKMADLVLLDGDPTQSIGNISRISAVILKGRLFRRGDLDQLLQQAERLANQN
jgi:imidazolonepropionase-like amidohydrolase